jgi:hypothetical protein
VTGRHTESADRVALEVELDDDSRPVAHDPAVVARLDGDDLGSDQFDLAAVGVLDVDLAASQEADVSVPAAFTSHGGLQVRRPAKAGGIDHPLDTRGPGADDVNRDAAHIVPFGALDRGKERIG